MQRSTRDALVGFLVGSAISAGVFWLGGPLLLAAAGGLGWAVGVGTTLHIAHEYPDFATGETWEDQRWTALGGGLLAVGLNLVYTLVPGSFGVRLAFAVLLGGMCLMAYTTATMAVLERTGGETGGLSPNTEAEPPVGGD
ncbi:hypothetical protein AUR64_19395 [Haloprofundus marisrubri]|uniref:Sterol desaturase n=1 Tax=Haloprofundus marisrubri TaxID=1514971 RepID=A0A0W1R4S1_9EURY|nr:hypothetical protein [Haloprofundus marisrubri]KTG08398.1 hypothetical protein AUR64_19395 [Haloprofundus marisrubri]